MKEKRLCVTLLKSKAGREPIVEYSHGIGVFSYEA